MVQSLPRAEFDGGLLGDQQVGVGRVRPAAAAVVEQVQDCSVGEVVERVDVAADGDAPVAQVDVVQLHRPDHLRPCRVDGGQGDDASPRACPSGWVCCWWRRACSCCSPV
ncbi:MULTISPECIES: hypothetical protein [Streptomyces]|uniref:hypothetical protein n=1 Tax=Streptomyces TaxID=1883 RepID=UPI001374F5E3|nr:MULTISPECIES: hypothetical protein [Streptomyces]QTI88036.1 hypothetical protein AS97_45050 [Streptomyces sp. AgN23]WTA80313.1 hypothetical protein OG751_10340 [Streptomyces antimycoticus]WTB09496.1 hypothetical protein OG546_38225 [Streptomyces antimycoticus]